MNISTLAAKKLENFTEEEKVAHYSEVCEVLGLDPRKRPFEYLYVDNEYEGRNLILYVTKAGSNQLRANMGIDIEPVAITIQAGVAIAVANAADKTGRTDSCVGAVTIEGLTGKSLANAVMSAETKAKRRVTISISGIGLLDETEVQDLSGTVTKVVPDAPQVSAPQLTAPATAAATTPTEVISSIDPMIIEAGRQMAQRGHETFIAPLLAAAAAEADRKPTTEEITEFRKRYEKLVIDLQMNGVIAAPGQTAAKRIRTWFLQKAGCDGRDLTFGKWRDTLGFMEQGVASEGIKGLVVRVLKETE